MAYNGRGGDYEGHHMQDLNPNPQQYRHNQPGEDDYDEAQSSLLSQNQAAYEHDRLGANTPPVRPVSAYSLTESYVPGASTTRAGVAVGPSPPPPFPNEYGAQGGGPAQFRHELESDPSYRMSSVDPDEGWIRRQQPNAAPTGGLKRYATRKIKLVQGSVLSIDYPVPSAIRNAVQPKYQDVEGNNEEFFKMRYTAATCDPNEFTLKNGYDLRPRMYNRHTELLIAITYYNEDKVLLSRTLHGVMQNIRDIVNLKKSSFWNKGGPAWQKIVVCLVFDGIDNTDKNVLDVLATIGVYQDGVVKKDVDGNETVAHIFEYTTQLSVTPNQQLIRPMDDSPSTLPPVQFIFCLKQKNSKKINSHRWLFNAFGRILNPEICILLDAGTKPSPKSLLALWEGFYNDKDLGGACGEIHAMLGKGGKKLLNPLVAVQNFEYKISNILDKPLESVFGYISVLPGAFSAYRYKALQNGPNGQGPLASYFKGETMHGGSSSAGLFERNMYLAEDRILCFEIVTKKREGWVLKYVKAAKASTDVPATVPEFISQRRRWLNGSLFASIHATVFFFRIWTSGQNIFRMLLLQFEFIYNALQLLFTWTSLANFYLAFFFLVSSATSDPKNGAFNFLGKGAGKYVFEVFLNLYIGVLFVVLVCSLGNRPQGSKWTYTLAMVLFGLCNCITTWCAGYTVYLAVPHTVEGWKDFPHLLETNRTFQEIFIAVLATYGLYFISSFMHWEPWHMFTSFTQYLFLLPSYVNILMMYAMCNLHDVTWGTKGDNGAAKDLGGAKKIKGEDGKELMEVELPTAREDVDQLWAAARNSLKIKPAEEKEHRDAATKQADHDRNSRTNVVLAWVGSNLTLILIFTSTAFLDWVNEHVQFAQTGAFNPYLSFLFIAFAGLSAIRFLGSFFYLVLMLFGQ